jgi:hypothetical protein
VAERTLNQAGNTLAQSTPTSYEPPSSAKKRMSSAHASIWLNRRKDSFEGLGICWHLLCCGGRYESKTHWKSCTVKRSTAGIGLSISQLGTTAAAKCEMAKKEACSSLEAKVDRFRFIYHP